MMIHVLLEKMSDVQLLLDETDQEQEDTADVVVEVKQLNVEWVEAEQVLKALQKFVIL